MAHPQISNPVRLGIVGLGNIGSHHAEYLLAGQVPRARLVAAVVRDAERAATWRQRGLAVYNNAREMFASGGIDAAIIATPHFQHPDLAIAALQAGLHVMVEKPIAAHKADAERLLAVRKQHPKLVFAAMFQLRTEPRYVEIKKLLTAGGLGEFVRFSWLVTDWFRTDAYYASGGWRATWRGEGGGVLINQCLHQLDMLQWLLGMPARVHSFVQLGRYHSIEVEDSVTAYLEFPNGATGVFIATTGEAPGSNRLEISGAMGKLLLENDHLTYFRNRVSMMEQCRNARLGFQKPEVTVSDIPFSNEPAQHATVMRNFVDAILDGAPLIAPGEEGLASIELANVLLYSGLVQQTVNLPLDAAAYARKLHELIAGSTWQKKVVPTSTDDFAQSFPR